MRHARVGCLRIGNALASRRNEGANAGSETGLVAEPSTGFLGVVQGQQSDQDFVSTSDSRVWFVEATDDEFVGMAFGFLDDPSKTAYLGGMWVEPGGRRSGIGKRLVESVVEWARARGAVRIELEVNELTRPAVALYRACGFAATGRSRPLLSDPSATALEMARKI
jgi:ribosomal protein S18 acetylase RimI-like enzyme